MGEQRNIANLANSGLPRRVHEAVARLLHASTSQLSDRINVMLEQLDAQLFKQAERARTSAEQTDLLKGVQALKTQGSHFSPIFFAALESRLALLRSQQTSPIAVDAGGRVPSSMWRVHDAVPQEETNEAFLRSLAVPLEGAASLPLYLLGQRFGVLAGAPAFSPAQICIGPRTLIELAGETAEQLFGSLVPTADVQTLFAQVVLCDYAEFVEQANAALDEAGVLPGLTYVPVRPIKASNASRASLPLAEATDDPAKAGEDYASPLPPAGQKGAPASAAAQGSYEASSPSDPATAWLDQPAQAPLIPNAPPADFRFLQQLLTAHRIAGKLPARQAPPKEAELSHIDIDRFLGELQATPHDASQARSIRGIREDLLRLARAENGPLADMGREASDTFEIMSLLHNEIAREVRPGSVVHTLLERLQVPILRLALQDKDFFELPTHPGRLLLNTIAEADASAYGTHSADPNFEAAMRRAVERMEDDFDGQPELLAEVNEELQAEFRQQIKRSQSNEKRVIAAARGRERMEIAQETAANALDKLISQHTPIAAVEDLMRRAWLDAMTLTVLRHGEESTAWRTKLDTTREILETVTCSEPVDSPQLATHIHSAMRQVGYHETEASALASHLSRSAAAPAEQGTLSINDLSNRIQSHTRLGEEDEESRQERHERSRLAPRNAVEEECYQHLRTIPFGTWMDFVLNQQGEIERRRLSWYSNVTDRALFINRRGNRVAEIHMDALARLMAQRQLRVVEEHQVRLIDRAFKSTIDVLRNALRGNSATTSFRPMR